MTDAPSVPAEPGGDPATVPFFRRLPDQVTVSLDGLLTLDPDITERPVSRVVLAMPDYVADGLAHLLAYLSRILSGFGGLDNNGIHSGSLAAALFGAATAGDYRCPDGVLHLERISVDPHVMGGVPCISGTRIPVVTIAGRHQDGRSVEEMLADYPQLTEPDVQAALDWPAETDDEHEQPAAAT
jgi:uncharacterized protein (DUF433 family)